MIVMFMVTLLSCTTDQTSKKPKKDTVGNIEWKSTYTPFNVTINTSYGYEYVGKQTVQKESFTFDYSVFKNKSGGIIFIIDYKRTDKKFPAEVDLFEPGAQTNGLLKYEPYQFSIWTGVSKRTFDLLQSMGVAYPSCKVAINTGRLNDEDRTTAIFVGLIEPWACDHSDFENIIDHYNDIISIW
jgi:hypothetical protein